MVREVRGKCGWQYVIEAIFDEYKAKMEEEFIQKEDEGGTTAQEASPETNRQGSC